MCTWFKALKSCKRLYKGNYLSSGLWVCVCLFFQGYYMQKQAPAYVHFPYFLSATFILKASVLNSWSGYCFLMHLCLGSQLISVL